MPQGNSLGKRHARHNMMVCVCGKVKTEDAAYDYSRSDAYIGASLWLTILVGSFFALPTLGFCIVALMIGFVVISMLIRKHRGHKWYCSVRWSFLLLLIVFFYL